MKYFIRFLKNPLEEYALEKSPEEIFFPWNNDPGGNFLWVFEGNLQLPFAGDTPKNTSSYLLSILTQSLLWNLKPQTNQNKKKSCQIVCCIIKMKNKKHVIMKDFDSKKIKKKKMNCSLQVFYLLQVFCILLIFAITIRCYRLHFE